MNGWFEWREAPPGSYAVIGDPISHSLSPKMHRAVYAALGLVESYEAIRVPLDEFEAAVEHLTSLGYKGLNVTLPLKFNALVWCRSTDAHKFGSVNTLRLSDRVGTNTDAPGFLATIQRLTLINMRVLVLGAGGSAFAIVRALIESGYEVSLYNRTIARAHQLAETLPGVTVVDEAKVEGYGLVVNTTSAGLTGEKLSIDWDYAEPGCVAYDLVYSQGLTPFLEDPAALGLQTQDGKAMLVEQGALSFEWWTGCKAPRKVMEEALK